METVTIIFNNAEECFDFYDDNKRKQKFELCLKKLLTTPLAQYIHKCTMKECVDVDDDETEITWLFYVDDVNIKKNTVFLSWGSFIN